MSESTYLTLQNLIPASFGSVTYFIQDKTGKQVNLTVPAQGSVHCPTDAVQAPWSVFATIQTPGEGGANLSSPRWSFSDPNAVIPSVLLLNLNPGLPLPGNPAAPGNASDTAGFAPSSRQSLLDAPQTGKRSADTSLTAPRSKKLTFAMQRQEQTQWCWAALAVSVSVYYTQPGAYTQCALANWAFGQTTCCINGSTSQCNQPSIPSTALSYVKCLSGSALTRPLTFNEVVTQIDAGAPIGLRVLWTSARVGHALSIYGFAGDVVAPDSATIDIADPFYGETIAVFKNFPANYHGGASWTHSYLTKAPS